MSLQVWLPLNGNLKNQGINNCTITNKNCTVAVNGKLGSSCYYFNGTDARIAVSSFSFSYPISICAWIKEEQVASGTQYIFSYNTNSGGNAGHAIAFGLYGGKLAIWHGGTYYQSSIVLEANRWYHVAAVVTSNSYKLYLDGNLVQGATATQTHPGSVWMTLGGRSNSATGGAGGAAYYFKGWMNDARFYNHALSEKEIKELAKCLILHYKLDNNGLGNKNILTNSTGFLGTTGWSGVVSTGVENGFPYLIAQRTNTSSTSRTFCTHTAITSLVSSWNPGDKFTISGYYKIPSIEEFAVGANMFIRWTYTTSASTYKDTGFTVPVTATKDVWIRFEQTFEVPASYENGSVNFYLSAFSQGLATIYWKQIKLEKGERATAWIPAEDSNIISDKIYDVSGYNNNGTLVGVLTPDYDSPRYAIAMHWPTQTSDANYIVSPTLSLPGDQITISLWFKKGPQNGGSNYHILVGGTVGGHYEISVPNDGTARTGFYISGSRVCSNYGTSGTLTDKNWHHIVSSFDGAKKRTYIDGNLINETSITGTLVSSSAFYFGRYGSSSTNYYINDSSISDIRIYTTALSDKAVKELYETSASIDDQGNTYGRELVEK